MLLIPKKSSALLCLFSILVMHIRIHYFSRFMLRRTISRFSGSEAAAASSACCGCCKSFQQYKTQFAAGGAFVVLSGLYFGNSRSAARAAKDNAVADKLKALEDDNARATAKISALQKEVKVVQTAVLSQESTIRKLADSLTDLARDLAEKSAYLSKAIEEAEAKTQTVEKTSEKELARQRTRLAELSALKAETDARFGLVEKQVMRCREPIAPVLPQPVPTVVSETTQTEVTTPAAEGQENAPATSVVVAEVEEPVNKKE